MKGEPGYNGPLLIDPRDPKLSVIKLSSDQIKILKSVTNLVSTTQSKSIAKDQTTQRELATLIQILGLSSFNNQNVNTLYKHYRFWFLSKEGHLISNKGTYRNTLNKSNPHQRIPLIGMDNWHTVICYLDSLLVSLFYSNDTLDFLLDETEFYNNNINEEVSDDLKQKIKELKIMLRYVVNLLRSGEFIPVQLMKQLCITFYDLGCDLTLSNRQEDALQFFEFFADCLSLPLLTIKLDIIHAGRMNLNDDLRLVEERALLISVPTDIDYTGEHAIKEENSKDGHHSHSLFDQFKKEHDNNKPNDTQPIEDPVSLEECLNSYFNNSITVKRHLDRRRGTLSTLDGMKSAPSFLESNDGKDDSDDTMKDYFEYERLGVVSPVLPETPEFQSVASQTPISFTSTQAKTTLSPLTDASSSMGATIKSGEGSLYEAIDGIKTKSTHIEDIQIGSSKDSNSAVLYDSEEKETMNGEGAIEDDDDEDDAVYVDSSTTPDLKPKSNEDQFSLSPKLSPVRPSISKVSGFSEVSRTRSSTIVSVLNNVANSGSIKVSKRTSSFSNNEVTLPAWMFLQLLPYYTDPNIKFKPENHEEYYRKKYTRSKTIDGDLPKIPENSKFEARYKDKRPIVPICLKRYVWDSCGKSHKIKRMINIPQIIKYPYFIAEDKQPSKPGLVNFERTTENVAPVGSFMLVLESCICHRGNSVHSGHYISVTRKTPFKMRRSRYLKTQNENNDKVSELDNNDQETIRNHELDDENEHLKNDKWIIFNDLEPKGQKTKEMTFEEAMEQEDPYILFYRIVNLEEEKSAETSEESDGFTSEDNNSSLKPVPIKLQSGSKEKFWSETSDSSAPNSVLLEARKGSLVSQISSISLKSQFQQQQQQQQQQPSQQQKKHGDEIVSGTLTGSEVTVVKDRENAPTDGVNTMPSILVTTNDSSTQLSSSKPIISGNSQQSTVNSVLIPPTSGNTNGSTSSGSGLKGKHFYFKSSRNNLKSHKETIEDGDHHHHHLHNSHHTHNNHLLPSSHNHETPTKINPDDINPLDPNYIDIKEMYYWYDLRKDGQFGEVITNENAHKFNESIEEGGILEKLNSKLSFAGLKRNSIAQSFSTSFSGGKEKKEDKEKDKEKEKDQVSSFDSDSHSHCVGNFYGSTANSTCDVSSVTNGHSNTPVPQIPSSPAVVPSSQTQTQTQTQSQSQSQSPLPPPAITSSNPTSSSNSATPPATSHSTTHGHTHSNNDTSVLNTPPPPRSFKNALNDVKSNSSSLKSSKSSNILRHHHGKEKENGKLKKFFKKLID